MDASDLIRALPNSLRGAGRPHMDESGRLPDARSRQGPSRVQPDRARLQSKARAEHPWNGAANGSGCDLNPGQNRSNVFVQHPLPSHSGALKDQLRNWVTKTSQRALRNYYRQHRALFTRSVRCIKTLRAWSCPHGGVRFGSYSQSAFLPRSGPSAARQCVALFLIDGFILWG